MTVERKDRSDESMPLVRADCANNLCVFYRRIKWNLVKTEKAFEKLQLCDLVAEVYSENAMRTWRLLNIHNKSFIIYDKCTICT